MARKKLEGTETLVTVPEHKNEAMSYQSEPYWARVSLQGTTAIMFHRYDVQVQVKNGIVSMIRKGSADSKVDNIESYVYRNEAGDMVCPAGAIKAMLAKAGGYRKDPRNARASMTKLVLAGVRIATDPSFGKKTWDALDTRPAVINRARIPRTRPILMAGWKLDVDVEILLPEYITPDVLNALFIDAGRLLGLLELRPDFGTFMVTRFEVMEEPFSAETAA